MKNTVSLITYGCAKNLVDSEVMLGYLHRAGYAVLPDPRKADVLILNTCGFIKPAKDEAEAAIKEAVAWKKKSNVKTVVAVGCYVERYKDILSRKYPEVDVWLGVKDFDKIVPALEGKAFRPGQETFLCSHTSPRVLSTPLSWTYLKISEGCSHECSFCAIPLIKGPYRSRSISSIAEEAEALAGLGLKEVNLISQDTTFFGKDKGMKDGLVKLLRRLADIPELRWIRLLYGYPEEVTEPLLDIMGEKKVCSYLDIPFQHAHPRILRAMRRSLGGKRGLALIEKIRTRVPDIALRTSIIVGFPGEGKKEFEALKEFVREARFEHLGVFVYSPEEGTPAFRLGDPVSEDKKQQRQAEVMELQAGISHALNTKYLGRRLDVIIESKSLAKKNEFLGRTRFQAPEVDGVVNVRAGSLVMPLQPLEKVEIMSADIYDLHGKISR